MLLLTPSRVLPAPLHRAGLRLAHAIRICWWQIRRPLLIGCRALAVNPRGEVLLVRHSYGSRLWALPGGGVARGEAPIAAATRELAEETACTLTHAVEVAVFRKRLHGATNVVHVIVGRTSDTPRADGREIVAARWFALTALPHELNPRLAENLRVWFALFASE
jgi:ADP-ribose pyrophosphatase YjhB (NUDIX family)